MTTSPSAAACVDANRAAGSSLSVSTGHEVMCDGDVPAGRRRLRAGPGQRRPAGVRAPVRGRRARRLGGRPRRAGPHQPPLRDRLRAQGRSGDAGGIGAFKAACAALGVIASGHHAGPDRGPVGRGGSPASRRSCARPACCDHPATPLAIALDVGGTKIAAATVDATGELVTPTFRGAHARPRGRRGGAGRPRRGRRRQLAGLDPERLGRHRDRARPEASTPPPAPSCPPPIPSPLAGHRRGGGTAGAAAVGEDAADPRPERRGRPRRGRVVARRRRPGRRPC